MESLKEQWPLHAPGREINECTKQGSFNAADAFGFDSNSNPDYENFDFDLCCSDFFFVELVLEEVVVVAEPRRQLELWLTLESLWLELSGDYIWIRKVRRRDHMS